MTATALLVAALAIGAHTAAHAQQTITIEPGAELSLPSTFTDHEVIALAQIVQSRGHRCDTVSHVFVSAVRPWAWIECNRARYSYLLEDKDGNVVVTVIETDASAPRHRKPVQPRNS